MSADAWADLRAALEDGIRNHPRSLQVHLGPSEVGNACDRCLVHLLAGHKVNDVTVPWLPTVGTAVHTWVEGTLRRQHFALPEGSPRRYLLEHEVTIGALGGADITGHCDIFDTSTGTVIDVKVVGKTTLDKVRRHGASTTYQRQIHGYGTGLAAQGHTVTDVMIAFLPRNAVSLQHAQIWQAPFDPQVTTDTLARANALLAGITTAGLDTVLAMTPEHTEQEFSCGKWPGETPKNGPWEPTLGHDLDGLVAVTQ